MSAFGLPPSPPLGADVLYVWPLFTVHSMFSFIHSFIHSFILSFFHSFQWGCGLAKSVVILSRGDATKRTWCPENPEEGLCPSILGSFTQQRFVQGVGLSAKIIWLSRLIFVLFYFPRGGLYCRKTQPTYASCHISSLAGNIIDHGICWRKRKRRVVRQRLSSR